MQYHRGVSVSLVNCGPTCCAYSKRELKYCTGGSTPGKTALLIESRASLKRPHSIILPTLLKSVSVAWRNKRTTKCKRHIESRRNNGTQTDGQQKEEEKVRGEG